MSPHSDDSPVRRRTTRACDQCRKTKSRCEHPPQSQEPCRNCLLAGSACTFLGVADLLATYLPTDFASEPSHKRGPPKGYLSALEQRLHDAEALLGVFISSSDPRATTLIADLSKDSLAASIITRVSQSSFGPVGRSSFRQRDYNSNSRRRALDIHQNSMHSHQTPMIDGNGHLVFTTPSNTWQDYLSLRLSLESKRRAQASPKSLPENNWEPSLQSDLPCNTSTSNFPSLNAALHFPATSNICAEQPVPTNTDILVDSPLTPSSTTTVTFSHETPEGDEGDDGSFVTNDDQTILAMEMSGHRPVNPIEKRLPYTNLAHSLGLETVSSQILGMPFDTGQTPESILEVHAEPQMRTIRAKLEDTDMDTWTKFVTGGSDSPSLFKEAVEL